MRTRRITNTASIVLYACCGGLAVRRNIVRYKFMLYVQMLVSQSEFTIISLYNELHPVVG